jgi:RimJ/RimL family protein N-acetyltransferase
MADLRDGMRPIESFSPEELATLSGLVGNHPLHRLYLEDALEAARRGARDRLGWLADSKRATALCIQFETVEVRTLIGEAADLEVLALAQIAGDGILHLAPDAAERLAAAIPERVRGSESLRYYILDRRPDVGPDALCRRLGPSDYDEVSALFRRHYAGGVFSRWMLEGVFLGVFEGENLAACGGVIASAGGVANIGNFLTDPSARGQGLARTVAATLTHLLADQGFRIVTLTTTVNNHAARRAFEAVGFRCFDQRVGVSLVGTA